MTRGRNSWPAMKGRLTLLTLFALFACKKDYTCDCHFEYGGNGSTLTIDGPYPIHDTKSAAQKKCDDLQANGDPDSDKSELKSGSCTLKDK
jgi:hypothetical protein